MTPAEQARILIVDDEAHVCELVSRWLSKEGHVCSVASSGEEALNLLRADRFDIVLSDILMPGMSGIDLLNIIKPIYPDVAVLMITAVDDKSTGLLAVESGAYGYVIKPFEKNEILIQVAGALARRREKLSLQRKRGIISVEVPIDAQRFRQVDVSLTEFVRCFKSGMDDAELIEEFNLSSEVLDRLTDQLVSMGKLNALDLHSRSSLSAATVVVDSGEVRIPESSPKKPVIDAADALKCIRSGMSDAALMKRYKISAKGLQSLFRKLFTEGLIEKSVIEGRVQLSGLSERPGKIPEGDRK